MIDQKSPEQKNSTAAELISELGMRGRTLRFVKMLSSPDPIDKAHAVAKLRTIRDPEAVRGLIRALRDPEPIVRMEIIHTLERINTLDVIHGYLKGMYDQNADVRAATAYALRKYPDKERALRVLKKLAQDQDVDVRETALESIAIIGGPRAHNLIRRAFADPEPSVRQFAVELSARFPRALMGALLSALSDPAVGVRETAKEIIAGHADESTRKRLIQMYASAMPELRRTIRELAELIGDQIVIEYIRALDDPSGFVRSRVLIMLEKRGIPPLPKGADNAS